MESRYEGLEALVAKLLTITDFVAGECWVVPKAAEGSTEDFKRALVTTGLGNSAHVFSVLKSADVPTKPLGASPPSSSSGPQYHKDHEDHSQRSPFGKRSVGGAILARRVVASQQPFWETSPDDLFLEGERRDQTQWQPDKARQIITKLSRGDVQQAAQAQSAALQGGAGPTHTTLVTPLLVDGAAMGTCVAVPLVAVPPPTVLLAA